MKVFISYSVDDIDLVRKVAEGLKPNAEPIFWDQDMELGSEQWHTIQGWIKSVDCVIALITDRVVARGEAVNQEIGCAIAYNKVIIPMISKAVDKRRLGCLSSMTYIEFDGDNIPVVIEKVKQRLTALDKTKQEQLGWAILAVVALVLLALNSKD